MIGLGNFRAYLILGKFLTNFGQKFKISKTYIFVNGQTLQQKYSHLVILLSTHT